MIVTLASVMTWILATLFIVVAAFMILVILIQKPKGGGLSGAFGGGGGGAGGQQAMFGAKVGDVLTLVTTVVFVLFLLIAIALVYASGDESAATQPQVRPPSGPTLPMSGDDGNAARPMEFGEELDEPNAPAPLNAEPEGEGTSSPGIAPVPAPDPSQPPLSAPNAGAPATE